MGEETTERLNDSGSFESRVLTALAAINGQLGSMNARLTAVETQLTALEQKVDKLEERVDSRLRETRPIWESVLEQLKVMDTKFGVFAREMLDIKADIALLQKHVPPAA